MVLHRRVLSFGVFLILVGAAVAFVAANWGRANDSPAGAALVSGRVAGTAGAAGARGASAAPAAASAGSDGAEYFAAAHLRLAQAESREISQLKELASDASASPTVRAEAQQQILQREQLQAEEASAELVLQAKGYPQSLVMLRPGGATVVVQASQFDAADAARVAQAVASAAGIDPAQVQIVPRGAAAQTGPAASPGGSAAKG